MWIDVRPTENDSTRLYKNGDISAGIKCSSNLIGRKSKCYFIIKFSLLLSIVLCWRKIRPDTGKRIKKSLLQVFSEMTTQRNGFGQNSYVADEQACVFGSCAFKQTLCFEDFHD